MKKQRKLFLFRSDKVKILYRSVAQQHSFSKKSFSTLKSTGFFSHSARYDSTAQSLSFDWIYQLLSPLLFKHSIYMSWGIKIVVSIPKQLQPKSVQSCAVYVNLSERVLTIKSRIYCCFKKSGMRLIRESICMSQIIDSFSDDIRDEGTAWDSFGMNEKLIQRSHASRLPKKKIVSFFTAVNFSSKLKYLWLW